MEYDQTVQFLKYLYLSCFVYMVVMLLFNIASYRLVKSKLVRDQLVLAAVTVFMTINQFLHVGVSLVPASYISFFLTTFISIWIYHRMMQTHLNFTNRSTRYVKWMVVAFTILLGIEYVVYFATSKHLFFSRDYSEELLYFGRHYRAKPKTLVKIFAYLFSLYHLFFSAYYIYFLIKKRKLDYLLICGATINIFVIVNDAMVGMALIKSVTLTSFANLFEMFRLTSKGYFDAVQEIGRVEEEKRQALISISGGLAHELNNPLAIISGYTGKLYEERAPHLKKNFIEKIDNSILRIDKITSLIKMIADSYNRRNLIFSYNSLGSYILENIERNNPDFKEITTKIKVEEPLKLKISQDFLIYVIESLVLNALEATNKSDRAKILLKISKSRSNTLKLSVENPGKEIDENIRTKMFLPFYSSKNVGDKIGLGLSLSQLILQNSGGSLVYQHRHSKNIFKIEIPICKQDEGSLNLQV